MSDLYPNIRFPKLDFSWLGELPDDYRKAKDDRALKDSLADLDSSDPKSLRAAAARAFAVGTKEGIDAGARLSAAAQARESLTETLAQKGQSDQITLEYLKGMQGKTLPPVGGAPADASEGTIDLPSTAPPRTPAPQAPVQGLNPQQLPPPPPGVPSMSAGPRAEAPTSSASEQMLASAEDQQAPQLRTSLAGPLPTPDTAPSGAVPYTEGTRGLTPPPAPRPSAPPPPSAAERAASADPRVQAQQEAAALRDELIKIPPKFARSSPLWAQFSSALSRLNLKPDEISYQQEKVRVQQENLARAEQGLPQRPELTRNDFKNDNDTINLTKKAAIDLATPYFEGEKKANDMAQRMTQLQRIINNPKFAAGESIPQSMIDGGINLVTGIAETLRARGVEVMDPATLRNITEPVALREAFRGLSNQILVSSLGSLSRTTDKDSSLLEATIPRLGDTSTGIQLKKDIQDEIVERMRGESKAVSAYMHENGSKVTQPGVMEAVRNYNKSEKGSIFFDERGDPNALGKRLIAEQQKDQARREFTGTAASARRVIPGQRGKINGVPHVIDSNGVPQPVE